MIPMTEELEKSREETPKFLATYKPDAPFAFPKKIDCRICYYPGAGVDWQPIRTLTEAGYAHFFVYADYGVTEKTVDDELAKVEDWRLLGSHNLTVEDLAKKQIRYHITQEVYEKAIAGKEYLMGHEEPFGKLYLLEQVESGERFAILYLCADGIATYDALFGNKNMRLDFLVLQDHGFGCNYDKFGEGGLMDLIAKKTKVKPERILCADNTDLWEGYDRVPDVLPVAGSHMRSLCRKVDDQVEI